MDARAHNKRETFRKVIAFEKESPFYISDERAHYTPSKEILLQNSSEGKLCLNKKEYIGIDQGQQWLFRPTTRAALILGCKYDKKQQALTV